MHTTWLHGGKNFLYEYQGGAADSGELCDARKNVRMDTLTPSQRMASVGIVQEGDSILERVAAPFRFPFEADEARRVIDQLQAAAERVSQVHTFAKGMGVAAPQIGYGKAAAVVRIPARDEIVTLLNPRIVDAAADTDEQYEGCLSFFDVRGLVPRPLAIIVEHQDVSGAVRFTEFSNGAARLVAHEIDHLNGALYRDRMRPGVRPIPVSEYHGTGRQWTYQLR